MKPGFSERIRTSPIQDKVIMAADAYSGSVDKFLNCNKLFAGIFGVLSVTVPTSVSFSRLYGCFNDSTGTLEVWEVFPNAYKWIERDDKGHLKIWSNTSVKIGSEVFFSVVKVCTSLKVLNYLEFIKLDKIEQWMEAYPVFAPINYLGISGFKDVVFLTASALALMDIGQTVYGNVKEVGSESGSFSFSKFREGVSKKGVSVLMDSKTFFAMAGHILKPAVIGVKILGLLSGGPFMLLVMVSKIPGFSSVMVKQDEAEEKALSSHQKAWTLAKQLPSKTQVSKEI